MAHLTSAHNADDIRIFHKECKALQKAGFDVSLVAQSKFNSYDVDYEGVSLESVPRSQRRLDRMTRTNIQVLRRAIGLKADVYHIHDPELLPALLVLKAMGAKTIYDAHEDVPKAILSKDWIPGRVRSVIAQVTSGVEGACCSVIDGVVAATSSIGARFPEDKTLVLQNFPVMHEVTQGFSISQYKARPPRFIYAGSLSRVRGIHQIVDAIAQVPKGQLLLCGPSMKPDLQHDLEQSAGFSALEQGGYVTRDQLGQHFTRVRAGLVTFWPEPNHMEAQPNKFFEYMAAGLPIIVSDFPLWREFINREACGLLVDPLDPKDIARAMQWILDNPQEAFEMGQRGAMAVKARYNWAAESQKLVEFYHGLVDGPAANRN